MKRKLIDFRFDNFVLSRKDSNEWTLWKNKAIEKRLNQQRLKTLAVLLSKRLVLVPFSFLEKNIGIAVKDKVSRSAVHHAIKAIRYILNGEDVEYDRFIESVPKMGYKWIYEDVKDTYEKLKVVIFPFSAINLDDKYTYLSQITNDIYDVLKNNFNADVVLGDLPPAKTEERIKFAKEFHCSIEGRCISEEEILKINITIRIDDEKGVMENCSTLGHRKQALKLFDQVQTDFYQKFSSLFPKDVRGNFMLSYGTQSEEAFEHYKKGEFLWAKRDANSVINGLEHFEKALNIDEGFDLAQIGKAKSYLILATFGSEYLRPKEAMPKVLESLNEINAPNLLTKKQLSDYKAIEASVHFLYYWEKQKAIKLFEESLALLPENDMSRAWYAQVLTSQGKFEQAIAEIERARAFSGYTSSWINATNSLVLYRSGRFQESFKAAQNALKLDEKMMRGLIFSGLSALHLGDIEYGIRQLEKVNDIYKFNSSIIGELGYAYGINKQVKKAKGMLSQLDQLRKENKYASHYNDAKIFFGMDHYDKFFTALEKAYEERSPWLAFIKVDPIFSSIKNDKRFMDFEKKLSLNTFK